MFSVPNGLTSVRALLVGGGGSGGDCDFGGGGGGYVQCGNVALNVSNVSVTVGAGGSAPRPSAGDHYGHFKF